MAYPAQATSAAVTAAGLVRLTGLAQQYLFLKSNYQPVDNVVDAGIDLRQKLEALALTAEPAEAVAFLADLGETYDLPEGVYTDPILRALVPPVPGTGADVRPFVLRIQGGKVLTIQGGKALGIGYRLVPNAAPVYNTTLMPTQTVGAITYNGLAGTEISFEMPILGNNAGPQQLFLYIGGLQVGQVNFPLAASGNGFSLLYNGTLYYGTFQVTPNQNLILA